MMLRRDHLRGRLTAIAAAGVLLLVSGRAWAEPAFRVLYTFRGGSDGASPRSLTIDKADALYGATALGGGSGCGGSGCGTVFKITPDGKEAVLYAFQGGSDGSYPLSPLSLDKAGNLYGVTTYGGASDDGTVFELTPGGTKTILHSFAGGVEGAIPYGGLLLGKTGELYGTTNSGGDHDCNCGTVFKLTKNGKEKILYRFTGGSDGEHPFAGLVADGSGNLYGITIAGGVGGFGYGNGTIFRIAPDGTHTVLYSFTDQDAGLEPNSTLIEDDAGNLYGTTNTTECRCGGGTVFKLAPNGGGIDFLYVFAHDSPNGSDPIAILFANGAGNFYGATFAGGTRVNGRDAGGAIFTLGADGNESTIYALSPKKDGWGITSLIRGRNGNLYGTALQRGASGYGTVFEVTP